MLINMKLRKLITIISEMNKSCLTKCLVLPVQLMIMLLINSCITQFIPETNEVKEMLVVEGLITDRAGTNTVNLSKSLPLGKKSEASPLSGCSVYITDDLGKSYGLSETQAGTYSTDSATFRGQVGRTYTLNIISYQGSFRKSYLSSPMEMKPVPPIDSLYYEKTVIRERYLYNPGIQGCQIYLDTHDPENNCRYFRWDYSETWVLRLPFSIENKKCWISENSSNINIQSTAAYKESSIKRFPINYITNVTDRLKTKYSILVNQYSLNEDEYAYWRKVQNISEGTGGLFDVIPASVPSNIKCVESLDDKVLGYFSVSASSSKRIYIKDDFAGIIDPYADCITDTIYGDGDIPGLGTSTWVLFETPGAGFNPHTRVITDKKGCADCTVRGTIQKPSFWTGD
jgi:hypothetical protein